MMKIAHLSAYKFYALCDLPIMQQTLQDLCVARHLKGTIVLSPEGINLMLAGTQAAVDSFEVEFLRQYPALHMPFKKSSAQDAPFQRLKVLIKPEIITFRERDVDPRQKTSTHMSPALLKQWLDEGRDFTLLDVRNQYEVEYGSFAKAVALDIDVFTDIKEAARSLPDAIKQKPLVMFCTGGVRCEKSGPFFEDEGFEDVYQLAGGIMHYFEMCGGAHYDGDCFVFDARVAVTPALAPSESAQ